MMGASLFGTWKWNRNLEASDLETFVYSSLHRSAWAVGLAWLVYACVTKRCGLLNRLLSWKVWLPLSRLTFGVYLIHPLVLYFQFWTIRERIYGSHLSMVYLFLGNMAFSLGASVVFYVSFEAPFRAISRTYLEKLLGCHLRLPDAAVPSGSTKKPREDSHASRNGDVGEKMATISVHL